MKRQHVVPREHGAISAEQFVARHVADPAVAAALRRVLELQQQHGEAVAALADALAALQKRPARRVRR